MTFIVCFATGKWQASKAKNDEELADLTVYAIERKLYWLENINRAYNKIQEIFDENKDKFECLKTHCLAIMSSSILGLFFMMEQQLSFATTIHLTSLSKHQKNYEHTS